VNTVMNFQDHNSRGICRVSVTIVIRRTLIHRVPCCGFFVSYAVSYSAGKRYKSVQLCTFKVTDKTYECVNEMSSALKDSPFTCVSLNVQIIRPLYTMGVSWSPCCLQKRVSEKQFGHRKCAGFFDVVVSL
jgi:hypothetical protein